ncbi:alpha/beta-tubulin-N-acetyltransferase 9 [Culicoides brevitarsis]|uniref:alpha/beta-tubulin-N-acetyltransferase 9 n=1 Tax=Culicoides brevitarsis TaxID=469753 RepID=UPI00307C8803
MKTNEKVKIVGEKVILVPYEAKHVAKYHNWMESEELQKATASVRLTLEQEYAMQKSWREDEDKCTFLILSKERFDATNDEIASLIGDTNLFILPDDEDSGIGSIAEAEIMIAETDFRRKGCGLEAMTLMILYGIEHLRIKHFLAKIGLENESSIKMFREKLLFTEDSRSEVFQEVTLSKEVDEEYLRTLKNRVKFSLEEYTS